MSWSWTICYTLTTLNYLQGQRLNWSLYFYIKQVWHSFCCQGQTYWQKYYCSARWCYHKNVSIKALDVFESYKYLENNVIKDSKIKSAVITNYKKRVRKILKSGKNIIIAINTWAIPLVRYTAGIVKWTQAEVRSLDVSTRKLLTMHKCFSKSDNVHRLYFPRN